MPFGIVASQYGLLVNTTPAHDARWAFRRLISFIFTASCLPASLQAPIFLCLLERSRWQIFHTHAGKKLFIDGRERKSARLVWIFTEIYWFCASYKSLRAAASSAGCRAVLIQNIFMLAVSFRLYIPIQICAEEYRIGRNVFYHKLVGGRREAIRK